jgi:hypothetical protein
MDLYVVIQFSIGAKANHEKTTQKRALFMICGIIFDVKKRGVAGDVAIAKHFYGFPHRLDPVGRGSETQLVIFDELAHEGNLYTCDTFGERGSDRSARMGQLRISKGILRIHRVGIG